MGIAEHSSKKSRLKLEVNPSLLVGEEAPSKPALPFGLEAPPQEEAACSLKTSCFKRSKLLGIAVKEGI